ncbi:MULTISPECIES: hypothetical protein [Methylosinus]|uniref:hypothetical protein n=1 Tax=Methylosinus TaxID=425 RepID=UPI00140913BF|nr:MULTISPECIES: hypothetical protein [Methylosinus]MBU3889388.1 hypothetical protein [Methylosinus sp. KRF6]
MVDSSASHSSRGRPVGAGGSAAAAGHGAMTAEQAMQDYVLVVNACLERRGYLLLR